MNDYGMRSLSEDSGNNLNHIHVESLCETMSDFLDSLEGSAAEFNNAELVEKKLSESECSILDCQLVVADIKTVSEDIDKTFIPSLERDIQQLQSIFVNLERITNEVVPALDLDLNAIEQLVSVLEARSAKYSRDKSIGWIKKFIPGSTVQTREDHTLYTSQVAECRTHKVEDLLSHFDGAGGLQDGENASLSTAKIPSSDSGDFAAL